SPAVYVSQPRVGVGRRIGCGAATSTIAVMSKDHCGAQAGAQAEGTKNKQGGKDTGVMHGREQRVIPRVTEKDSI
ncbi:MAG: hypothetical protein ACKOAG_00470, partial [Candidatus Kapaibacterium sp.]